MKTDQTHKFLYMVWSQKPAKVEVDEVAGAAYIRFNSGKVARTEVKDDNGVLVTMDYDDAGNILGAELVGISGFGLQSFNAPTRGTKPANTRASRSRRKRSRKKEAAL
jgi:uncharacterized protein YuzE